MGITARRGRGGFVGVVDDGGVAVVLFGWRAVDVLRISGVELRHGGFLSATSCIHKDTGSSVG